MDTQDKAAPAAKPKRRYDNSRRQQQVANKKRRILETALKLINSDPESFTMRQLALKARMPERTLYHLYGDRDTLLLELNKLIANEIMQVDFKANHPRPEEFLIATFNAFEKNPRLIKGYLDSILGREARNLFQDGPEEFIMRSFAPKSPDAMTPEEATRWAIVCSLFNAQTWRVLADCNFAHQDFRTSALVWAIRLLIENLHGRTAAS